MLHKILKKKNTYGEFQYFLGSNKNLHQFTQDTKTEKKKQKNCSFLKVYYEVANYQILIKIILKKYSFKILKLPPPNMSPSPKLKNNLN